MSAFLAAALSLPTVLFTALLGFFLIYALMTILGALDIEWLDGALDFDDTSWDAGVPLAVVVGVSAVFAWLTSFAAMKFLPETTLVKVAVGLGAAAIGAFIGGRVCRPFRRFFVTAEGPHRQALVGKICTIRSLQVSDATGTADVGDLVAEVRCFRENTLTIGSKAIVYDYDAQQGTYHVGPVDPSIAN
ncbi:MAG TPA: hypothetical protein VF432_27575 [Thermoanaerobaculia bacterium]